MAIRVSIPCGWLATALGEDSIFMAALEGMPRPEVASEAKTFRPPPMRLGLEDELL
ncbi:hypothetical protein [Archangium sp. Cb G35]|uniref:hypothetical protein n=1 Tax=Archangium sp. Cb G35 TaxID=1920190 RepID=UPI000A776F1E|nr:hypothetical protein [Archangium sp. Cb G35]